MNDDPEVTPTSHRRRRLPFFARILAAMVLGVAAGLVFGPRTEPLGLLGNVIIGLIKTLAAPLLFFAVVDAFLRTRIQLRSGLIMLAITATNAALAILVGLTLSNTLRPGDHLTVSKSLVAQAKSEMPVPEAKKIDFLRELTNYIPSSVLRPFLDNSIISIIILALLSGVALRKVKNEQITHGVSRLSRG